MPSGHRVAGVDFDDLFDPDVMGDGPTAPGFARQDNGQPLRYAAAQYGQLGPDTGRRIAGVDLKQRWARKGSAVYKLPFDGAVVDASVTALSNSSGTTTALAFLEMNSNGTYRGVRQTSTPGGGGSSVAFSGSWLPAGHSAADYEVQFETTTTGTATVTNGATAFASMSATRAVGASVSTPSNSGNLVNGSVAVVVRLRRAGSGGSTTNMTLAVSAAGFV